MPYGSRGHVLTRAERKEYSSPPIAPATTSDPPRFLSQPDKVILPRPQTPPKIPQAEPLRRVSVIKRVPTKGESAKLQDAPQDAPQNVPEEVPEDESKLEIPTPEPVQVRARDALEVIVQQWSQRSRMFFESNE